MTPYSMPNILVSLYTLILGILVIRANPRAIINRLFFLLSVLSFIWLFSYGILYLTTSYSHALRFGKFGHMAAVALVPTVYWFVLHVLGSYKRKLDVLLAFIAIMASAIAALSTYLSSSYFLNIQKHFWGYYPSGGVGMLVYTVWTVVIAGRLFYILNDASKKAAKELQYDDYLRFKYYALSLTVFIFCAVDFFPKFGVDIYPFGFIFVAAFSSLITYAIIRHHLLDVRIIIRRGFVYSALIAIITFIYLTIILLGEHFFRLYFGYASIVTAILTSSIIAITFNPLRLYLQNVIDINFFGMDPEKLVHENQMLRNAVQEQDRMKAISTLAAGMAHEIKNPLTSIKTFAEYLPKKYDDPQFRETFSRIVVDEVDRVNNIVKQLLEFSKPSEPSLKKFRVHELLEEIVGLLSSNLLEHKIEFAKDFDSHAIILADRNQLKQVFLNILLNSIQSMPVAGKLYIIAKKESGKQVKITIADTGCGMSAEQKACAFDPFFSTKEDGTGLGLAIVHSIITRHGGKITIQSELGKGTTVNVFLKSRD